MRSWLAQKFSQALAVAGAVGGTEIVVATVTAPTMQSPDGAILLEGQVNITPGVAATAATLRIRRGNGITGTQVGADASQPASSAVAVSVGSQVVDTPGSEQASQTYSLCLLVTGGTAAVTVGLASLSASVT